MFVSDGERTQKLSITGVAMIAFIPGNSALSWSSKMKLWADLQMRNQIFWPSPTPKLQRMAVAFEDSGNGERKDITGEISDGKVRVIIKVNSGYLLGAFSGGSGQQDVDVFQAGLEWLSDYY